MRLGSGLIFAAVALAAVQGFTAGSVKEACGLGGDAFAAWRETSLARRSGWYAKAEQTMPKLFSREVKPVGVVKVVQDASAFQGWRAVSEGEASKALGQPMNPGDSFTLDFGEHLVGTLAFSLVKTQPVIDAPVRLKFIFAEVPLELGEDARKIESLPTLSRSWLQHEVVTIDVVPSEVRLPRRYAFRYVKIEVVAAPGGGRFGIDGVSATAVTSADVATLRAWTAPSPALAKIDEIARRTLRNCMQTVFEDGPKRDRRLWLGDLRLEALADYETYRNFATVKRSLYVLAGTVDDDARLSSDAYERPRVHRGACCILDYTALFAATVLEYLEASGDRETAEDLWPVCVRQLDFLLDTIGEDGVFRDNGKWWCFIDWQSALNRQTPEQGALAYGFRQTLRLAKVLGRERDVAFLENVLAHMEKGAEGRLWNEGRGLYVCEKDGQSSWMGQAWMVIGGLAKGERAKRCLKSVMADAKAVRPVTPYANHYFTEALYEAGLRNEAEAHLIGYWGRMVELGADTFWEVFVPGDQQASPYKTPLINSYCHAWSCAPAYFLRNAKFRAAR
ncbi:MAG: sugar hydrolase [Kiritimatiellae bacterium]|nr:sugar hydrolase [Kiritimatiellia bacterium]